MKKRSEKVKNSNNIIFIFKQIIKVNSQSMKNNVGNHRKCYSLNFSC